jgi:hypothetical protein
MTAVEEALLTDDDILGAVSARAGVGIASDLLVSSEAREKVSERLARRFSILPLSVSESGLEIATSDLKRRAVPAMPGRDMIYHDQSFTSDRHGSQ